MHSAVVRVSVFSCKMRSSRQASTIDTRSGTDSCVVLGQGRTDDRMPQSFLTGKRKTKGRGKKKQKKVRASEDQGKGSGDGRS